MEPKLVSILLEPLNALNHINVIVSVNYVLVPVSQNKHIYRTLKKEVAPPFFQFLISLRLNFGKIIVVLFMEHLTLTN